MIVIDDLLAELRSTDEFILLEEDEVASIVNYIDSLYQDVSALNQRLRDRDEEITKLNLQIRLLELKVKLLENK